MTHFKLHLLRPLSAFLCVVAMVAGIEAADLPQYTGYTRPGLPSDKIVDGKVIFASDSAEMPAMGGTVYFTVLERNGQDANDPWNTGIKSFADAFHSGIDFNGGASPSIDLTAKYLYLYQVVNDRRTQGPIESASVKLLVDLKEISSWGYFQGLGFGLPVTKEGEKPAIRAVSFNNVVAGGQTERVYRSSAPAVALSNRLQIVPVPTKRGEKESDEKGKIVNVIWDPLDPALAPDFVMLLGGSDFAGKPSFRAIWSGKNNLPKDGRGVLMGFTSNLPPALEPVRLRTTKEVTNSILPALSRESGSIKQALDDGQTGGRNTSMTDEGSDGIVAAEGKVPTPKPETTPGPPESPLAPPPSATAPPPEGGGGFVSGGSTSFPGAISAGSIGFARNSTGGGGGSGSGGGNSGNQQAQAQDQAAKINFNALLVNQQLQAQLQAQAQAQRQSQHSSSTSHSPVPEPASYLGMMLGVPLLIFMYRRRTRGANLLYVAR